MAAPSSFAAGNNIRPFPPITREQVREFELVQCRCAESLMRATMAGVPDDGQGYAFFESGDVRSTLTTNPHALWAVGAYGLTRRMDEATLDAVMRFFDEHQVPPRVRIVPDGLTKEKAAQLAAHGLRHFGFHTMMWAPLPMT